MGLGPLRTLTDVIRELQILNATQLRTDSLVLDTLVSSTSSSWAYYPSAVLQIETNPGDLVELSFLVRASVNTGNGRFNLRLIRNGTDTVGRQRSYLAPMGNSSGDERQIEATIYDRPRQGNNIYRLQWCQTQGAGTIYSSGAEFFVKVFSTIG